MIVGGANTAEWDFQEGALEVSVASFLMHHINSSILTFCLPAHVQGQYHKPLQLCCAMAWLLTLGSFAAQLLRTAGMVLLQREIPEEVNARVAAIAGEAGVPVLLDCGGVEGSISSELMHSITTLSPNETELARLTGVSSCCAGSVHHSTRNLGFTGATDEV